MVRFLRIDPMVSVRIHPQLKFHFECGESLALCSSYLTIVLLSRCLIIIIPIISNWYDSSFILCVTRDPYLLLFAIPVIHDLPDPYG